MLRKRKGAPADVSLAPVPSEISISLSGRTAVARGARGGGPTVQKAIIEWALGAELTHQLGYPPGGTKPEDSSNHRNGTGGKTLLADAVPWRRTCPAIGRAVSSHD